MNDHQIKMSDDVIASLDQKECVIESFKEMENQFFDKKEHVKSVIEIEEEVNEQDDDSVALKQELGGLLDSLSRLIEGIFQHTHTHTHTKDNLTEKSK